MLDKDKTAQQLIAESNELRRQVERLQADQKDLLQTLEILRKEKEYMSAMHETTLGLLNRLDRNELLETIIRRAVFLTKTEDGFVYILEPGDNEMELRVGLGIFSDSTGYRVRPGEGVAGKVWQTGMPMVIEDYKNWPYRLPTDRSQRLEHLTGVPLLSGSETVGVIGIGLTQPDQDAKNAGIDVLTRFAELASIAIDNARLYGSLKKALAERDRVNTALRESESRLSDIINFLPDATFAIDSEGKVVAWNRAIEEMTGVKAGDMLGKGNHEHAMPFYKEKRPILIDLVLMPNAELEKKYAFVSREGDCLVAELDVPTHVGGRELFLWGKASPIYDFQGKVAGAIESIRDITERKTIEKALRESEQRLKNVFAGYSIPTFLIDKDHKVVYWSKALEVLSGIKAEEVTGTSRHWRAFYRNERPCMADLLLDEKQQDLSYWYKEKVRKSELLEEAYELTDFFPDLGGEGKWLRLTVSLLRDSLGAVEGALETLEDVTARKTAEAELKSYSERLEEMVEERTRELQEAQEQLIRREKLAILGQLAGGVGHELRNPLGVISNAAYYLKMVLSDADETVSEYLNIISSEVRNSEKIVSDLLDFSRIRGTSKEAVTISHLVSVSLEKRPPPEHVEVITEIPLGLAPAYVDSSQMVQVLMNLVINAIQAMPEGGRLILRAKSDGDMILIFVIDEGPGISEENMKKIFDPLFTTKARGIGLGLAVSKNLVEANGGWIGVESEEGRGSTFTLALPAKGGTS